MELSNNYQGLRRNFSVWEGSIPSQCFAWGILTWNQDFFEHIAHSNNDILNQIILWLGTYFFPVHAPSKQKQTMRHGKRRPYALEVKIYSVPVTKLNGYLTVFMGSNQNNKIGDMELKITILHIIPNGWVSRFLQSFDFEAVIFQRKIYILECAYFPESNDWGVCETSNESRLYQTPKIVVSAVKLEEYAHCQNQPQDGPQ